MRSSLKNLARAAARLLARSFTPAKRRTTPTRKPTGAPPPSAEDIDLDDGVVIEYAPCLDGDPDPGEVVWTWVPYEENPAEGKDRPVVIFGRHGADLVGVALTSKRHPSDPQVEVGTGEWDQQRRPSYAKLDRILEIDPEQVRREGAVLDKHRFDDLVAALRRYHRVALRSR